MNYAPIAPWYQPLSRIVFGDTLIRTQCMALDNASPDSRLLIAGGGDGEILKHLRAWNGPVDFVEISAEMLRLARSKATPTTRFIHRDIFDFQPDHLYDVMLFPFLLDNFLPEDAEKLIVSLRHFLDKKGQVIVVDYTEKPSFWQKILLQTMYFFFRIVADVRVKTLPPIEKIMQQNGFQKTAGRTLCHTFIEIKHYTLI